MAEIDFTPMMRPVAEQVLGEPNQSLSNQNELRWGNHGSMSVDLEKGTWFDHSSNEGGGVLALLAREMNHSADEAFSWLRANGFEVPDNSVNRTTAKRRIVKTYDYVNESDELVFQVCRWEPKNFTQRRPVPDDPGAWINGLRADKYMRRKKGDDYWRYNEERAKKYNNNDVRDFPVVERMPIYRLPEFLKAVGQGLPVLLLEGEKDCDNAWAAGLPATTVAGGSKKWQVHYADYFKGAHLVMVPDNDATGRQHTAQVGLKLKGITASTKILDITDFWPDAPTKADLSDWQGAGNDLDEVFDLIDTHAKDWTPEPPPSNFRALSWSQLDQPGIEHEFLIQGMLTRKEVAILYAPSGQGKSFLALDMALSVARGVPYRDQRVLKGGVIYQAGEGGIGIKKRARAYRQYHMGDSREPLPFTMLLARVDLFADDDKSPGNATGHLIAEIKAQSMLFDVPLELIVIDTFATATPGANENASSDISKVLSNCERIQRECDATVLLIHHTNAAGDKPRGHSSIIGNIENSLEVIAANRTDTEAREGLPPLVREVRRLIVRKNKDDEAGGGFDFILRQVKLGKNKYGEEVTSCVCTPPVAVSADSKDAKKHLTDQEYSVMETLFDALSSAGINPPTELELPKSIDRVVLYKDWRIKYASVTYADDEDETKARNRVKQALQRAGNKFMRRKFIAKAGQYIWLTGTPIPGFEKLQEQSQAVYRPLTQQENEEIEQEIAF